MNARLIDWTSPEVLGAWSVCGPNRFFARCPFAAGSAKAHRWWVARDKALGIRQGRYATNAGDKDLTIERISKLNKYD